MDISADMIQYWYQQFLYLQYLDFKIQHNPGHFVCQISTYK